VSAIDLPTGNSIAGQSQGWWQSGCPSANWLSASLFRTSREDCQILKLLRQHWEGFALQSRIDDFALDIVCICLHSTPAASLP